MLDLETAPFTPLHESLARLDEAVSPLAGIVGQVTRATHAPDESRLVQLACRLASSRRTIGVQTTEYGGGLAQNAPVARAAAIGEAIERYSGAFVPVARLHRCTATEIGSEAVDPASFALFHPRQLSSPGFPFVPFTSDTRLHFVDGRSLADGRRVYLPAQLVFLRSPDPIGAAIGYPTSNGLACGATVAEAVLAGLLELVERDAVMLAWNNRLSLPLLDWSGDPELAALDRRLFASTGLRYSVVDATVFFGIPVAFGVVHGPSGERAALAVGGGAGATVKTAWLKALSEAFGVFRWLRKQTLVEPERQVDDPLEIVSFADHTLYYAPHARAREAAFFDCSPHRTPTHRLAGLCGHGPAEQIAEVVGRLRLRGVSAYAVDVTAPDVRALGLSVVKVVAPELCALDVAHAARYLGGRRLYHASLEAGLVDRPLGPDDLNPLPHPFP